MTANITTPLGSYINGNYTVTIHDDGTKIKETQDNQFIAQFPESIDIKITNQCDILCGFCHENSTPDGKHGSILGASFISTLRPYTEIAIGGGNPLSHPDLIDFLRLLKSYNIIANMTVNQKHFMSDESIIAYLIKQKLIYGLGVSLAEYDPHFIDAFSKYENGVLHVINGVVDVADLKRMYGRDLKLLILGYKHLRRGEDYYNIDVRQKQAETYSILPNIVRNFKVASFDNLALEQLDVRWLLSDEEWDEFYQGDDGSHTMYIDMVERKFAVSSTSSIRYDLLDSIDDMFAVVRNNT